MMKHNKAKPSSVKIGLALGLLAVILFASAFFIMGRSA